MSLSIDLSENHLKDDIKLDATVCHAMPCHIHFSGPCNSAQYLATNIEKDVDQSIMKCSFRGRPLLGQMVNVPSGYKGFVLKEGLSTGENRELNVIASFSGFTAWNYDQLPSENDVLVKAMDWIHVANAIHTKVGVPK